MKRGILFLVSILGLILALSFVSANEIKLTDEEFSQGKTLDVNPYDKIIFNLDGADYSVTIDTVGVTGYSKENVYVGQFGIIELSISENNRKTLTDIPPTTIDDTYTSERKFEVNYDFKYDVDIRLEVSSLDSYRNKTAKITIKKINEEIPENVRLNYYCAKFYKCPDGKRVRYTEIKGNGCALTSNPITLCEGGYTSCNANYYNCESTGKRISLCKQVGVKGTLGYGCECIENPEQQCGEDTCTKYYACPDGTKVKECEWKQYSSGSSGGGGSDSSVPSSGGGGGGGVKCECVDNPENLCSNINQTNGQNQTSGGAGGGGSSSGGNSSGGGAGGEGSGSNNQSQNNCSGCMLKDKCVNVGYISQGKYCDINSEFKIQNKAGLQCQNNFECDSNLCINNQCVSGNLWQKILNWFSKLFGGK